MFTSIYLCLPIFNPVYPCLTMFTNVYSCLPMFTPVYSCLHLIMYLYQGLPMFTRVYICDPTLEKGPYGANYDIELREQKDEELKFWRKCFYHIYML